MIRSLGFKRVLILVILGVAAVVLGVLNYYIFVPQAAQARTKLNAATSENATLSADIETMRTGMARFKEQKVLFDRISKLGVFNEQNRVLARERFGVMQKLSKILAAKYEIKPAALVDAHLSKDSTKPDTYAILRSPISVNLSALDDLDVYRFIYYLNYGFPGHITIRNLHIERDETVSTSVLREIGGGNPPSLIKATMDLDWSTIVNRDSVPIPAATDDAAGQGGQL